jgi:hypothetical protein
VLFVTPIPIESLTVVPTLVGKNADCGVNCVNSSPMDALADEF